MKHKGLSDDNRRSFIKGVIAAGAAAFLGSAASKRAQASNDFAGSVSDQEVLYRETQEFRAYYDSLKD